MWRFASLSCRYCMNFFCSSGLLATRRPTCAGSARLADFKAFLRSFSEAVKPSLPFLSRLAFSSAAPELRFLPAQSFTASFNFPFNSEPYMPWALSSFSLALMRALAGSWICFWSSLAAMWSWLSPKAADIKGLLTASFAPFGSFCCAMAFSLAKVWFLTKASRCGAVKAEPSLFFASKESFCACLMIGSIMELRPIERIAFIGTL